MASYQVFVPGRVCLFGEHSDWAGGDEKKSNPTIAPGRTIVVGTNQGIHASCTSHSTNFIVTSKDETGHIHGPFSIPMTTDALLRHSRDPNEFFRYACGVAYHMLMNYRVGGLEVNFFWGLKYHLICKIGLKLWSFFLCFIKYFVCLFVCCFLK